MGSFIAFAVTGSFSVFLLTLKNKSSATLHLGIALAIMAVFNAAYLIPYSIYQPWAAYHRWVTVGTILPVVLHFTQFLLRFPKCDHPRLTTAIMIAQWAIHLAITAVFIYISSKSGVVFNATGHYFDLDADTISTIQSAFIVGFIAFSIIVAVWRFFIRRGAHRWALLGQALILFFVMMIPAVLNSLSRDGLVSRELFQNAYAIFVVIGLFIMVVVFLNTTPDRTSFMSKIIGISLATFLLVMQILASRTLTRRDVDYDTLKKEEAGRVMLGGRAPDDMAWLRSYNPRTGQAKTYTGKAPDSAFANLLLISAWREGFSTPEILTRLGEGKARGWLQAMADLRARQPGDTVEEKFAALDSKLRILKSRLTRLSWLDFRERAEKFLNKQSADQKDAVDFFLAQIHASKAEGRALRQEVADAFMLPLASGARDYPSVDGRHFVSFRWYDPYTATVYEAGYQYLKYRAYIRDAALDFFILTIGGLFLLLTVFPVFFHLALVSPLNKLLAGVAHVNEGNLDARVKVVVEDEIGTLARSFNNMTVSIREARQKLQEYAVGLEEKVRERTKDLEQTLGQVQELKAQQDGDYFLTSLMLNPLGSNRATSDQYRIEFLVKQKKQFDFKHWQAEIGGDICVADRITLKDEDYIVILNADAMGKSMQGAGGAVVLGSAFHAILDRCRVSRTESNRFPEAWIRDAFVELHKIFAVFDGSMLVSIFLGLIHEKSGAMFFTNAEHPWPVVIRAGRAEFLKTAVFYRKLGIIPGQEKYPWKVLRDDSPFHIDTFQMKPGDILLVGSDGRDDLMLGVSKDQERVINEDENIFRRIAEETNGDLKELFERLTKEGEITDDLSLIRVEANGSPSRLSIDDKSVLSELTAAYKRGEPALALKLSENVENPTERAAARARIFFKIQNFAKAIEEALTALALDPLKDDLLYVLVRSYKKLNEYAAAFEYAERFRLRNPGHTGNLVHLAHLATLLHFNKEAELHAEEALRLDASLTTATQILQKIGTRSPT